MLQKKNKQLGLEMGSSLGPRERRRQGLEAVENSNLSRTEQRHFSSTVQKQKQKAYDVELCQGRAGKKKKNSWPCFFKAGCK